jgi:hypothetical protein
MSADSSAETEQVWLDISDPGMMECSARSDQSQRSDTRRNKDHDSIDPLSRALILRWELQEVHSNAAERRRAYKSLDSRDHRCGRAASGLRCGLLAERRNGYGLRVVVRGEPFFAFHRGFLQVAQDVIISFSRPLIVQTRREQDAPLRTGPARRGWCEVD